MNDQQLRDTLQAAISAHRAKDFREADRLYTSILNSNPNHPDANHNLGVLAKEIGKPDLALQLFQTALKIDSTIPQYWISLLKVLLDLKQIDKAKKTYKEILNRFPNNDLVDQQLEQLSSVINFEKDTPDPYEFKELLKLFEARKFDRLLDSVTRLLRSYPKNDRLYELCGLAYAGLRKYPSAIKNYDHAIQLEPKNANLYANLGNAQSKIGNYEDALKNYHTALKLNPKLHEVRRLIGVVYKNIGKLDDALKWLGKAIEANPELANTHLSYADVLIEAHRLDEAKLYLQKAIKLKVKFPEAYQRIGNISKMQGDIPSSIKAYTRAIKLNPNYTSAFRSLCSIKAFRETDTLFRKMVFLYRNKKLDTETKTHLCFALANIYDQQGMYKEAFNFYEEGNVLRKKFLNYDFKSELVLFEKIEQLNSEISNIKLTQSIVVNDFKPIFIIGMPRSGTTLTEQIVSNHSQVYGGGELKYFGSSLSAYLDRNQMLDSSSVLDIREKYIQLVNSGPLKSRIFTDKQPLNFKFIPIIFKLFPNAKVIHVYRSPAATCWSNYKQFFPDEAVGFCYDLSDIVAYYSKYTSIMLNAQNYYGDRIYNLDYDRLTKDPEKQIKSLIKYLRLPWEPLCLKPEENRRYVWTASQQQVKKKIYTGSSSAWQVYKQLINIDLDDLETFANCL